MVSDAFYYAMISALANIKLLLLNRKYAHCKANCSALLEAIKATDEEVRTSSLFSFFYRHQHFL